jgi:putative flippase GtrA
MPDIARIVEKESSLRRGAQPTFVNPGSARERSLGRLHDLFTGGTRHLGVQFFRYTVSGALATVADFGTYAVLVKVLNIHYLVGNAGSFTTGMMVNYLMSIWWVFPRRQVRSKGLEFAIFTLVGLVALGISELCMYIGVHVFGIYDILAKVLATGFTLVWNFSMRKRLLFHDRT